MLEQGPDFWCWFNTTQFSYMPLCSPNTCKYVFNPNVITFQLNCTDGLPFSAFIIVVIIILCIIIIHILHYLDDGQAVTLSVNVTAWHGLLKQ